jgi:hypothetical protein
MGMGMDSPLAATPVTVRGVHAAGHLRRWNSRGWDAESAWGSRGYPVPRRRQVMLAGAGQGEVSSVRMGAPSPARRSSRTGLVGSSAFLLWPIWLVPQYFDHVLPPSSSNKYLALKFIHKVYFSLFNTYLSTKKYISLIIQESRPILPPSQFISPTRTFKLSI